MNSCYDLYQYYSYSLSYVYFISLADVLLLEHLLSKELTRKMSFHPRLVVYNHMCRAFFRLCMLWHVSGMWYKILAYGTQIAGY